MKFFLDANIHYSALEIFKELNLDVIHARDVKLANASDKEIMKYSIKNKRILVTKDLDFGNIIKFPVKFHYGIVILRLPYYLKAFQTNNILKDFLSSVNINDLHKSITIIKLGRYRIRKFS